jgi:hypothetical protein
MPDAYLPGFTEAYRQDPEFMDKHRLKVLRMAGHAAAVACFFVERRAAFDREQPLVVGVEDWLMAMGVVRSACMVGRDSKHPGVPCNRRYFPINKQIKSSVVEAFSEITANLMTDDQGAS